jgi:hypothetical protein
MKKNNLNNLIKITFITLLTFVVIFTLINFDSAYNQRNYFVLSKERIPTITKVNEDNENYYFLINDEKCNIKFLDSNVESYGNLAILKRRESETQYLSLYDLTVKKNSDVKLTFGCYHTLSKFPMFRYHFKI